MFINAPLRDYSARPRVNDFTLPVLGLAYIATAAKASGFNVAVLDAEALGLGLDRTAQLVNDAQPRWAGFNLLAPTYEMSAAIAQQLDPDIALMLGGHQAKAMPVEILTDPRFARTEALVIGEGETRVPALLTSTSSRAEFPGVMWVDRLLGTPVTGGGPKPRSTWLSPDINALPLVDRTYLVDDPYRARDGRIEANMVGSRGCPYNCSFCGAAVSANEDITIRTRSPQNLMEEMYLLRDTHGVTAIRFVDDLFLGYERFINECMTEFAADKVGDDFVWDATGRINILARADDALIDSLVTNGCREIALGIESGSSRVLHHMGKRIAPEMTLQVVERLTRAGINVKGYFIVGFPTETQEELQATERHVEDLWSIAEGHPGWFRASVFEFRPYPGTPEWKRLVTTGGYSPDALLRYTALDLTSEGLDEAMRGRDEFNFSVNLQFGEAPLDEVRATLVRLSTAQHVRTAARRAATADVRAPSPAA